MNLNLLHHIIHYKVQPLPTFTSLKAYWDTSNTYVICVTIKDFSKSSLHEGIC